MVINIAPGSSGGKCRSDHAPLSRFLEWDADGAHQVCKLHERFHQHNGLNDFLFFIVNKSNLCHSTPCSRMTNVSLNADSVFLSKESLNELLPEEAPSPGWWSRLIELDCPWRAWHSDRYWNISPSGERKFVYLMSRVMSIRSMDMTEEICQWDFIPIHHQWKEFPRIDKSMLNTHPSTSCKRGQLFKASRHGELDRRETFLSLDNDQPLRDGSRRTNCTLTLLEFCFACTLQISYPANVDKFCAKNDPLAEEVESEYRFCVFVGVFLQTVISKLDHLL